MRSTAALASPLLSSFLALAVIATTAASTGCKSAREKAEQRAAEAQTGGQIQLFDGGLILTTDAGIVALGASSKLPDDFPKTIPVYPHATVNMAARSAGTSGKPAWSLSLETGDEQPKVVAFYASGLAASAGAFKKASDLAMGDTQMTVWQSAQYDVTLMISAGSESQTTITMTVAGK